MVPWRRKPHETEGVTNILFHPRNRSWAVPKHRHNHPSFDWMKANSFQVNTSVTDGNEVIPKIIARPKQIAPMSMKYHEFQTKGWCIKNEMQVWATGVFIIDSLEFLHKICWKLCKIPFILCTLLSCSLIAIEVTTENVKIYFFHFFSNLNKKKSKLD